MISFLLEIPTCVSHGVRCKQTDMQSARDICVKRLADMVITINGSELRCRFVEGFMETLFTPLTF